jgi:hypothetical protein
LGKEKGTFWFFRKVECPLFLLFLVYWPDVSSGFVGLVGGTVAIGINR